MSCAATVFLLQCRHAYSNFTIHFHNWLFILTIAEAVSAVFLQEWPANFSKPVRIQKERWVRVCENRILGALQRCICIHCFCGFHTSTLCTSACSTGVLFTIGLREFEPHARTVCLVEKRPSCTLLTRFMPLVDWLSLKALEVFSVIFCY